MNYTDRKLVFDNDKIYYYDKSFGGNLEVMMDWEDDIMKAKADYVCKDGGDILEIGFGMGISAGHIQSNSIDSHTIVENHPQVLKKLKAWAAERPNVIIVEGGWYDVKDSLSKYDGVLYDTWGDVTRDNFTRVLPSLMKPNGRATWWNNFTDKDDVFFINGTTYEAISVNPVSNVYFNSNTYYLPKKQF